MQEALSILNTASQCGDASITSACRSGQEGQELKASPDYMRPCSQNIITGQQDDGSVGNLVTPISSLVEGDNGPPSYIPPINKHMLSKYREL